MPNSRDNMDYNFTSDIPEDTTPGSPEYIMSNSQRLIVPDSQGYISNHEQHNNPDTYLKQHPVNSNDKKQQSKVLSNSNTNIIQKQNLKLNDSNENYSTNKLSNNKQTNNSDENKNSEQTLQDNLSKKSVTVRHSTRKRTISTINPSSKKINPKKSKLN
ncbi:unnamed protein product [Rhizophagus irregularis]|nr:unnamed protein product [Rhizophagus irregularis]